ncbi:MAG: restriction endonuclease, partial [Betaproteobacteria bacterium HGW-Betaproteobacteria-17]
MSSNLTASATFNPWRQFLMQGQLFSHDFLTRGILDTAPWHALDQARLDAFSAELRRVYRILAGDTALNEAQTESELIEPVLAALGWEHLPQINMSESGREDVPDFLLFADATAKARALAAPSDDRRVRHGVALLEAKSWLRVLDRSEPGLTGTRKPRDFGAPSSQMLRYLSRADVMSDRAVKWGILTNGAVWRLYWQDARSRAEDFFEINLAALLGIPGTQAEFDGYESDHGIKLFYLLFGRAAFLPQTWDAEFRTFHAIALSEARRYEEAVSQSLGQRVFDEVFPALANALAASDLAAEKTARGQYTRAYLDEVREATLVLLYRMLFVLYAEDRALLPIHDPRYRDYSLRVIRDDIADKRDRGGVFSSTAGNYWGRLTELFIIISDGDDAVGMP